MCFGFDCENLSPLICSFTFWFSAWESRQLCFAAINSFLLFSQASRSLLFSEKNFFNYSIQDAGKLDSERSKNRIFATKQTLNGKRMKVFPIRWNRIAFRGWILFISTLNPFAKQSNFGTKVCLRRKFSVSFRMPPKQFPTKQMKRRKEKKKQRKYAQRLIH